MISRFLLSSISLFLFSFMSYAQSITIQCTDKTTGQIRWVGGEKWLERNGNNLEDKVILSSIDQEEIIFNGGIGIDELMKYVATLKSSPENELLLNITAYTMETDAINTLTAEMFKFSDLIPTMDLRFVKGQETVREIDLSYSVLKVKLINKYGMIAYPYSDVGTNIKHDLRCSITADFSM